MGICDGRVVIITGAARGLGREYALGFAAEGAHVVLNDLGGAADRKAAEALAEEIKGSGGKAVTNHDDIADWDGAGRLIRAGLDAFGALHAVVNNAGILRIFPFEEEPLENWDRTIQVHLRCDHQAADGDFRVRNAQVLMARTIAMPQDPTSR